MNVLDIIKNYTVNLKRYRVDNDGIIIVPYFNPLNINLRHEIFKKFYETIKHMPHLIIEGQHEKSELFLDFVPIENKIIQSIKSLNWCKEGLLNIGIDHLLLKNEYKYVFWLDSDIKFQNLNWMVDACQKLRSGFNVVQPFKLIKHLPIGLDFIKTVKNENICKIDADIYIEMSVSGKRSVSTDTWYSFGYKHATGKSSSKNYEAHGHVGMAWGAHLALIGETKLYPGALIGGADHIMAHAFAEHTCHSCIQNTFSYDEEVLNYSETVEHLFKGRLTFVDGLILHEYHGDLKDRDYYRRIKNNSKELLEKSKKVGHLYETDEEAELIYQGYMATREIIEENLEKTNNEVEFGGGSFGGGASSQWEYDESINENITKDGADNLKIITEHVKNAGVVASVVGVVRNTDPIEELESNIENTFS